MLGDSHMMGMESVFFDYAVSNNFTLTTINRSECQYTPNLDRLDRETGEPHKCTAEHQTYRRDNLLSAPPSYGHQVVLIYPIPEVGWDVPKRLVKQLRGVPHHKTKEALRNEPITTSSKVYHERQKSSFAVLNQIQHPNIHRVYPHEIFCDTNIEGRCITHDQDNLFYSLKRTILTASL